jgi:hypothetical protein
MALDAGVPTMDKKLDVQQQPVPPAPAVAKRQRYERPTVTIYGNLQQITGAVGVTGGKDGGAGMKNVRTSP